MKCASLYWFSEAEHENGYEVLFGYSFQEKIQTYVIPTLHTIPITLFIDWLVFIKCTASSPAVHTLVQENLLLLTSNSLPTSVNSNCSDMSSPLVRYHDEKIRHAHCSMPHIFLEKYLGENLEKGSLKTYWSLISERKTTGFPLVHWSCQPCYFPQSWLLKAINHSKPSSRYAWEFELLISEELVDRWKQPSSISVSLIPGNFSVR